MNEDQLDEITGKDEDVRVYRKPYESESFPISNDQQLGQDILRTFARMSDPPIIEMRKVRKRVPKLVIMEVKGEDGRMRNVPCIVGWVEKEWEFPILIQPKYHELITDDLSRGFLSEGDLEVARTVASYCNAVKSFSDRYDLDLSLHHNSWVGENNYLIISSGAFKGKRVQLAKTNIAEQSYRSDMTQSIGEIKKKKKGFFNSLLP